MDSWNIQEVKNEIVTEIKRQIFYFLRAELRPRISCKDTISLFLSSYSAIKIKLKRLKSHYKL